MSKPLGNKWTIKDVTTPVGVAIWPSLIEPDAKYNKIGSKLRLTKADADAFRTVLEPLLEQAEKRYREESGAPGGKLKTLSVAPVPITEELDRDTGDPTGFYLIGVTREGAGVSKKDGKPWKAEIIIKDARGNVIPKRGLKVWSGTELRFNAKVSGYYAAKDNVIGITLDPVAAQIRKLVSGGVNSEFESMDDGYVYEDATDADTDADDNSGQTDF